MTERSGIEGEDDLPVAVYSGAYQDVAFVFSLLTGSGIDASMNDPIGGKVRRDPRVLVRRRDVDRAQPLIEDFRKHGRKKTW